MDKDLNIGNVLKILLDKWRFIFLFFILFSSISIIYSLTLYNKYRSTITLVPNPILSQQTMTSSSSFGGLASIAGINLGSNANKHSEVFIALSTINSQQFIADFVRNNNLLVEIMAAKGWDEGSKTFVIDKNVFDIANNRWTESEPTDFEIFEKFTDMLSATQEKKTMLVYISFEHYSPIFAQEVVELLLRDINKKISERRLKLTKQYITSLTKKIASENSQIILDNISRLILEQQRLQMLAELSDSYLFNVLEYPLVAEKKSGPKRSIIVIASSLFGIFFSIVIILTRRFLNL